MKLTPDELERIEAFLDDQLPETDYQSFKGELNQNADLRAEVELQRELRRGLRTLDSSRFFDTGIPSIDTASPHHADISRAVKAARQRYEDSEKGRVIPFFGATRHLVLRYGAIAASVLILSGGGWWNWQQRQEKQQKQELAVLIAEVEPDFTDKKLKQLSSKSGLKNKSTLASRQRFEWYLALGDLKQGKDIKARARLLRISNTANHPYQAKAKALLQKLPSSD